MDTHPHQSLFVSSGDVRIHCRKFGQKGGTPIIILHGLSFFSYDWIETAAELAGDREVIAMDMRGFGESSWSPSQDYSVETMASDVVNVADAMGWRKWISIGHSMGGRTSTWCAARNPGRVEGLILVDYSPQNAEVGAARVTETVGRQPNFFPSLEAAMDYFGVDPASESGRSRRPRFEAYLQPCNEGLRIKRDLFFRDQFRRTLETGEKPQRGVDMWRALADVRCPILVVRGTQSDMFAATTVPRVLDSNPRIALMELDAGHDVIGDARQGFERMAQNFLSEVAPSPGARHALALRGVDHLALVTDDMPATMDFYTRVLGMQLVHVRRVPFERDRGQPPYEDLRHYFFDMGNDSLLAFFEYPRGLQKQNRDLPGGMQHLAFSVERARFDRLIERVKDAGVPVIGPVPLGGRFWSAYFYDPNGIRLEFATSTEAGSIDVVDSVLQHREEARSELATLFDDPVEVERWLAQMALKPAEQA